LRGYGSGQVAIINDITKIAMGINQYLGASEAAFAACSSLSRLLLALPKSHNASCEVTPLSKSAMATSMQTNAGAESSSAYTSHLTNLSRLILI